MWIHKAHCCRRCPQPHLSQGHASDRPGASQALCSQGPRGIGLRLQGCSSCIPRTHCGRYGDSSDPGPAQLLRACTHKARPLLASGVPAVSLDVLHVLNSQSWWRRCNSVSVQPWIEISFPFLKSHGPWDSAVISAPPLCMGSPPVSGPGLPRRWLEHASLPGPEPLLEAAEAGARGWGVRGCHGAHPSLHAT